MNLGPVHSYMREILAHPASEDLILIGGAAILMKLDWLARRNSRTLLEDIPSARATEDLDFALSLDLFIDRGKGSQIRAMIDELGYKSKSDFRQFVKGEVQLDLLARLPEGQEKRFVKHDKSRVGSRTAIYLHGMTTPEAFAIERSPLSITAQLDGENGDLVEYPVRVAHPYGLLNMKVRAAHDRYTKILQGGEPRKFSEKHSRDVYTIVAAMTEQELDECRAISRDFANHEVAKTIRAEAALLFSTPTSHGLRDLGPRQTFDLDHPTFWDALQAALDIPRSN